jgi:hypothetical protein
MSIRRLRQTLTFLTVILATLVAVFLYQRHLEKEGTNKMGREIVKICQLPDLPEEVEVRHALVDRSEDERFVDVILTLTGPTKALNDWLKEFDQWEKKRPGLIQNHRTREAEMSSRFDFTAEVFVD